MSFAVIRKCISVIINVSVRLSRSLRRVVRLSFYLFVKEG